jgi:hypothetical protein
VNALVEIMRVNCNYPCPLYQFSRTVSNAMILQIHLIQLVTFDGVLLWFVWWSRHIGLTAPYQRMVYSSAKICIIHTHYYCTSFLFFVNCEDEHNKNNIHIRIVMAYAFSLLDCRAIAKSASTLRQHDIECASIHFLQFF